MAPTFGRRWACTPGGIWGYPGGIWGYTGAYGRTPCDAGTRLVAVRAHGRARGVEPRLAFAGPEDTFRQGVPVSGRPRGTASSGRAGSPAPLGHPAGANV